MRAIWVVLLGLKNNRAPISSRMQILHFGQIHNDGEYCLFPGIVRLVRFGVDRPSKMLLGHEYVPSSGDVGCLPIGLSFPRLATSEHTVINSENVITFSPIAAVVGLLTDLINDPDIPFCHGALAGVNSHFIPSATPNSCS